MAPCLQIVAMCASESLTRVLPLAWRMAQIFPRLAYVLHDNACGMVRHLRKQSSRRDITAEQQIAWRKLSSLRWAVDRLQRRDQWVVCPRRAGAGSLHALRRRHRGRGAGVPHCEPMASCAQQYGARWESLPCGPTAWPAERVAGGEGRSFWACGSADVPNGGGPLLQQPSCEEEGETRPHTRFSALLMLRSPNRRIAPRRMPLQRLQRASSHQHITLRSWLLSMMERRPCAAWYHRRMPAPCVVGVSMGGQGSRSQAIMRGGSCGRVGFASQRAKLFALAK